MPIYFFLFYAEEILLEDLHMSSYAPFLGRSQDVYIFGLCIRIIYYCRAGYLY